MMRQLSFESPSAWESARVATVLVVSCTARARSARRASTRASRAVALSSILASARSRPRAPGSRGRVASEERRGRGMVVVEPVVRRGDESHRGDRAHRHARARGRARGSRAAMRPPRALLQRSGRRRVERRAGPVHASDERPALVLTVRSHGGVQSIPAQSGGCDARTPQSAALGAASIGLGGYVRARQEEAGKTV